MGWEYIILYSTDGLPTDSRVSLYCDQYVFFKKNLLNQCLNFSLVSEVDKEIGFDYLRAMHLSDSKTDYNSKKEYHQNIGLYVLPTITD